MRTLNNRLQLSILNRKKAKNLAQKGFTLIELLITVVILGTLTAIALPNFLNQADQARIQAANSEASAAARDCIQRLVLDPNDACADNAPFTAAGPSSDASATINGTNVVLEPAT